MSDELLTARLRLKALSASQLEACLNNLTELETEFGFPVSPGIIDDNVPRAINMKLAKMVEADTKLHDWYTYWLMIIKAAPKGVGLIGFKGYLNAEGRAEVGYGIDAEYRNQGYMTEALISLSKWAFLNPSCRALTATTVSNPASERVLEKAGWQKIGQNDKSSDWELVRRNMV